MQKSTLSDYQPDKVAQQDSDDSAEAKYWKESTKITNEIRQEDGLKPTKIWTPPKDKINH